MPDGKVYNRQCNSYVHVFGTGFMGWLMSDGYAVYRRFQRRLRCWAHLIRKAEGLKYSLHAEARTFGQATAALLSDLMTAIYQAREGPPLNLTRQFRDRLDTFRRLGEQHRESAHRDTRALAREFLNDWEAIWIIVAHPYLPLTNNEAEVRFVDPKPSSTRTWGWVPSHKEETINGLRT